MEHDLVEVWLLRHSKSTHGERIIFLMRSSRSM